jgi:hypothetical protein
MFNFVLNSYSIANGCGTNFLLYRTRQSLKILENAALENLSVVTLQFVVASQLLPLS